MKKAAGLLLILVMVFVLCGCEVNKNVIIEEQDNIAEIADSEKTIPGEESSQTATTEVTEQDNGNDEVAKELTVYRTRTGVKYHRNGCQHLSNSKIETTVEDAKAKGLKLCLRCNPPQ